MILQDYPYRLQNFFQCYLHTTVKIREKGKQKKSVY